MDTLRFKWYNINKMYYCCFPKDGKLAKLTNDKVDICLVCENKDGDWFEKKRIYHGGRCFENCGSKNETKEVNNGDFK